MCIFNQTIHVCGHTTYTINTSCPVYLAETNTCAALPTKAFIPTAFLHRTTTLPNTACAADTCVYTVASDPFHASASAPRTPGKKPLPSFKSPQNLGSAELSLYDELMAVDPDLTFLEAMEAETSASGSEERVEANRFQLRFSRGIIRDGVYRKYSRLSRKPKTKVNCAGSPEVYARTRKRYGGERERKRRRLATSREEEELVCGLEALSMKREEAEIR